MTAADIPAEIDGMPVTGIWWNAFNDCTKLTRVTVPAGVSTIRNGMFSGCSSLTSIEVAEDNPNYASVDGVVFSKDKTELVLYPTGRSGAYEIPAGVTKIRSGSFTYSRGLTRVTIPASVTDVEDWYAFSGCFSLMDIEVAEDNPNYCSVDGVVFNKDKTALLRYPAGRSGVYEIPAGVTEIGDLAFDECVGLTDVVFPAGVARIGDYAFDLCHGLTDITLPEGVTEIGYRAFAECAGLQRVAIPVSTGYIDEYAFDECPGLLRIDVAEGNPDYCSVDGVLFNKEKTMLVTYPDGRSGAYEIPDSVTTIGWVSFGDCAGLTSVTIPVGVTEIEFAAFYGCDSLTDVYYRGTEAQWQQINIHKGYNDYLTDAEIHYNSGSPDTPDKPDQPDIPSGPVIVPSTTTTVTPAAVKFDDVPEDAWYAEAVNALAEGGILIGKGKDKFDPDGLITLAELSVIYCRLIGDDWQNGAEQLPEMKSAHWAKKALERTHLAESFGDASGDDFKYADAPAFRGDTMTLFAALAIRHGLSQPGFDLNSIPDRADYTADRAPGESLYTYADNGHRFIADNIDAAYTYGIVIGVDKNHSCQAFGTVTRAQVAQMCYNMGWTTAGCLK